nr:hypothetical protein 5 [Balneolaceae bacterium]
MPTAEERLTIACANHMRTFYPDKIFMHIANERKTKLVKNRRGQYYSAGGKKLKNMGVLKGVADMFIPEPNKLYAGLWIELKSRYLDKEAGKYKRYYPKKSQREFLVAMHERGYAVAVAWDGEQFASYVKDYFNGKPVVCDYLVNNHLEVEDEGN